MNDRFFLDTNILVYSFGDPSSPKTALAERLIQQAVATGKGIISYQVVQEFFNVAYRRFPQAMSPDQAMHFFSAALRHIWTVQSSPALLLRALQLIERYRLPWYDALILAGALEAKCAILYTEDFQNGQKFDDLEIRNPFLESTTK